eukprot:jgi/Bigna1/85321/estExt_fgenesh1_pg.C_30242
MAPGGITITTTCDALSALEGTSSWDDYCKDSDCTADDDLRNAFNAALIGAILLPLLLTSALLVSGCVVCRCSGNPFCGRKWAFPKCFLWTGTIISGVALVLAIIVLASFDQRPGAQDICSDIAIWAITKSGSAPSYDSDCTSVVAFGYIAPILAVCFLVLSVCYSIRGSRSAEYTEVNVDEVTAAIAEVKQPIFASGRGGEASYEMRTRPHRRYCRKPRPRPSSLRHQRWL